MSDGGEHGAAIRSSVVQWPAGRVSVGLDQAGRGRSLLLLPALSSISTRGEMEPLLRQLAPSFEVASIDWPGFGDRPRPRADWTPELLSQFLAWVLDDIVPRPETVIAAGHAATYAAYAAAAAPNSCKRLVLVAPTWRGPLPTMVGAYRPWFGRVVSALDMPGIGPLLYRANVSRPVLEMMAREHVYQEPTFLAEDRLQAKRRVTGAPGARHASARFVTGKLDRVGSRDAFLGLVREAAKPTLVVIGAGTPRKSLAEMDALGQLPNVEIARLAQGRLAPHEEFPAEVAAVVRKFCSQDV